MIEIVPYKPSWPAEFHEIRSRIRSALGDLALRIDHIGSTAVPGLDAKDILDMQLSVHSFDSFEPIQAALEKLGYEIRPAITFDHRPPGFEGPASEWEKRYFHPPAGQRVTHLHVRVQGRANQRYALVFRDYMRAHADCSAAYADLKHTLARYYGQSMDHTAYVEIKDPVCDVIMSAANEWAARTAWRPGPSDV
jgi:GrpB-like predicted nucleotidyltransferase (UPF0157 family)